MEKITSESFNTKTGYVIVEIYDTLNGIDKSLKYIHSKVPTELKIRYISNVKLKTVEDAGNIKQPNYIETRLRKVKSGKIYWVLKHEINDGDMKFHLYVDQLIEEPINIDKAFYKHNEELNLLLNECLNQLIRELNKKDKVVNTPSINSESIEALPANLKEALQNDSVNISNFLESVSEAKKLRQFKSVCDVIHYVSGTPSSWLVLKKLSIKYNSDSDVVPDAILDYICTQA